MNGRTFFAQVTQQLKDYVRRETKLNTPDKNGVSQRKHLESFRKQLEKLGRSEESLREQFSELEPLPIPDGFQYLITVFYELSSARSYGAMGGVLPLSYLEIKAYQEVTDQHLEPYEVEIIKAMDSEFVSVCAEISETESK